MKKFIILFISLLLLGCLLLIINLKNDYGDILFKNKKKYEFEVGNEKFQKDIDIEISKYISNKEISFDSPKVILDPYNSSSLSALIIFYTKAATSIKLYINNEFVTTVESSNSHVIPVYGLKANYNNKIIIEDDNKYKNTLYIQTDKIKNDDFYTYETKYNGTDDLFLNTTRGKYMIDNAGDIVWYMNINNTAMYLTDEKKLYFVDKYNSLIETDFMGRIYKKYHTTIDYNIHTMQILNNGNIMVIDGDRTIVEINKKTGKIVRSIDIYKVLKKIDRNFEIENEKFYINHIQYNEEKNTLLISVRTLNAVINYDLNTNKMNWIFSNHDKLSSRFDKYKLKLLKGDYFIGQHTPHIEGDYLYVFNNNIFSMGKLSDLSYPKKSQALIYKIDGMNVKEVYRYESDYLGGWYGSFFKNDKYKNINFGCIINDELGKYSKVIELDEKNNVISNFTTNYNSIYVYQSFRENFYNDITLNYDISDEYTTIIDNLDEIEDDFEKLNFKYNRKTKNFVNYIKNAYIDETIVEYSNAGLMVNTDEDYEIIFIDNKFNYYSVKLSNNKFIQFKRLYYNIYFSEIRGKYAVYVKINNKYYNPNFIINFK